MNNYVQPGRVLDLIAPAGGVVGGKTYKIGSIIAIATTTKPQGVPFAGLVEDVSDVDAVTGQAWTSGQIVYWDDEARLYTVVADDNAKAGYAVADKVAAAPTGRVKLIPTV